MVHQLIVLACAIAAAQAGVVGTYGAVAYGAAPVAYGAAPVAYAAPVAHAPVAYAAPVAHAPVLASTAIGSTSQSTLRSLDGSAAVSHYSKAVDTAFSSVRKVDTRITSDARLIVPVATYSAAPALVAHAAPAVVDHAAPAVFAHAAPAIAAAPIARAGLLGVAYSAAPAVAHISFDGLGAHYAW